MARRKLLPADLAGGAFLTGTAIDAGLGWGVLRGPSVSRVSRGLYLDATSEPSTRALLAAYLAVLPQGCTAVDGVSALQLWGFAVGAALPYRYVTTARHHSIRPEVRIRRTDTLPASTRSVLLPLPALVAARHELGLVSLVVAGDWLIRDGHATLPEVRDVLAATHGRDCRVARQAGALVRAGSESPQESRLRMLIVLAGLPVPETNVDLGDDWFFIGRVDLYLRAWNVAVEYEGEQHRTDPRLFAKDLKRHEALAASGVLVVRVAKEHLRRPREVVRRIHQALVSRGYDGPAPSFGPLWRDCFRG